MVSPINEILISIKHPFSLSKPMLQRKRKIHKKDPCNLIGEAINLYLTILNLVDLKSYEKEIIKS